MYIIHDHVCTYFLDLYTFYHVCIKFHIIMYVYVSFIYTVIMYRRTLTASVFHAVHLVQERREHAQLHLPPSPLPGKASSVCCIIMCSTQLLLCVARNTFGATWEAASSERRPTRASISSMKITNENLISPPNTSKVYFRLGNTPNLLRI